MDKELQVVPQQLPQQAQPTPVSLTQTGNDNTQIAYVARYEQNVAIFSFHSLEYRIVKTAVKERENGCTCPPDFPVCVCGFHKTMRTVCRPITADEEELRENPRARSARLRIAERIEEEDRDS